MSYTHVYFPAVAPPLARAGSIGAKPERPIPPATPTTDVTVFWNKSLRDAGTDCFEMMFDGCCVCGLKPSTVDAERKARNPSRDDSFIVG